MKVLIIGVKGFIGRNLFEYFSKIPDFQVQGTTREAWDILDEKAVKQKLESSFFDVIIHCAIYNPRVGEGKDAAKELEYNLRMFFVLEKYKHLYGKMIYFGSGAEFDKRYPICSVTELEQSKYIPDSVYGLEKYIIGKNIESCDNIYNLRVFGLFGKYENWSKTFISGACCKAIKNVPITIRQNLYFDYLYIADFCRMVKKFIDISKPKYHTYHMTSGKRIDLRSLAEIVVKISRKEIPVIVCKDGIGNEYTASNDRIIEEIGMIDFTPYEEAIRELYNWYQAREADIDLLKLLY